jgi:hypothetical protein
LAESGHPVGVAELKSTSLLLDEKQTNKPSFLRTPPRATKNEMPSESAKPQKVSSYYLDFVKLIKLFKNPFLLIAYIHTVNM